MRGGIFASLGAESEVDDGPAPLDPALLTALRRYLPGYLEEALSEARPRRGVLVNVLHRLNSVEHLLSTYLPRHLVQALKRRPVPGWVGGERLHGSLLFADVSGFTALSERLSRQGQEGIEQLTAVLNRYFESMLDILARSDGILLKFAGDALWAYFPEQRRERQAEWAVRAALRMHRAVEIFSAAALPLKMKIGVATGELYAMRVGSPRRMEYVVLGEAVVRTMEAEGQAVAGQVILDGTTAAVLPPELCTALPSGFHALEHFPEVDEFEICAMQRRRRSSTAFLMASHAEILAEIAQSLRQVEVLASYLPAVLVRRLLGGGGGKLESENRPTTVLFANVWGFKELLDEGADLQQVTGMLSDYFRAVEEIVGEYEGVVARIDPYSRGSKMLVLFGALVTHEDDPERAIRSALALGQRLRALNARWQRTYEGVCVEQRMGVTQGRTFAGPVGSSLRREYTVMGDDVNLAARLMGAAEPGQILIAREVEEDLGGRFRTSALLPIHVKGKAGLIPVYQVDGFRGSYLAGRLDQRGALVGREAELERVRGLLRDVRSGSGRLLVLEGAAGVGKSHFVDALAQVALEEGVEPWLSACTSYGAGMPYGPWLDLVRSLAEMEPGTPPEARGEQLRRWLERLELLEGSVALSLFRLLGVQKYAPPVTLRRLSPEVVDAPAQPRAGPGLFQRLGQRVGAEGSGAAGAPTLWSLARERQAERSAGGWKKLQERVTSREQERLYEALVTLLKRLTKSAPGLLIFENAQWMDAQSRALLRHLTAQLQDLPLLVVVVRRPAEGGSAEEDAYGGEVVRLSPLDRAATGTLLAQLLGATPSAELLEMVHSRSEGNPLFVEELARWLKGAGAEALLDPLEAFRSSNTLQELVMTRLDALSYLEQSAVRGAAVVGITFTLEELGPLLEDTRSSLLSPAARKLVAAGFALEEAPEEARYAFRQTLMREIVYDSQPYARRRELHARLAAYLEARPGGEPAAEAELLAHHYRLAHRWLPAAHYLLVCGRKARQRYAYDGALSFFEQALQALERLPAGEEASEVAEIRAQLHEGVGDVALLQGDLTRAASAYREARALLEAEGVDAGARLLRKQALVLPVEGRADEAEATARLAWERRAPQDAGGTAALLTWLLWRAGDAESEVWARRAQALVAERQDEWAAGVRVLLADLAGETAARRDYLALERRTGAALLDCRRGDRCLEEGDLAAALTLYERAGELWQQEEDAQGLARARYRQARVWMQQGGRDEALALLERTLSLLEDAGSTALEGRGRIRDLLEQLRAGQNVPWPAVGWQRYDDAFRISLLFDPEELQMV